MKPPPDDASITEFKALFATLAPPAETQRSGFYRARFVGPWWLRRLAGPCVALGGLPGWRGKRFCTPHEAINVCVRGGRTREVMSMQAKPGHSRLDGGEILALTYGDAAALPWCWVRDELRTLDGRRLLAMTTIEVPLLRGLALPFVLERDP